MLLANHGVLVFHRTPELAILVGGVVEEAAQAGINAAALGGPAEIEPGLRAAALQRAMTFDSQGTVHAYGRKPCTRNRRRALLNDLEYDDLESPAIGLVPGVVSWADVQDHIKIAHSPLIAALAEDAEYTGVYWTGTEAVQVRSSAPTSKRR